MEPWLVFLGRLHPMVLHAPIGLAIGLFTLEAIAALRRKPLSGEVRGPLVWLLALSTVATVVSGLLLRQEGGYPADLATPHQILGIAGAAAALAAVLGHAIHKNGLYAGGLIAFVCIVIPAGHLGASLTHGENFLIEPFRPVEVEKLSEPSEAEGDAAQAAPAEAIPAGVYASDIRPLLARYCVSCHGAKRSKGGLALHTQEAILAGSEEGDVLVAGDPAGSELLVRMRLPLEDDDHMPPKSKPQPSPAEVAAIEAWIAAGAPFEGGSIAAPSATTPAPASAAVPGKAAPTAVPAAAPEAIAALTARLIHVEPVAQGRSELVVDVSAIAKDLGDDEAIRLLQPLKAQIADLNLARSAIGDKTVALVASMPALRRLNLSATATTDVGVAALATSGGLEELILTQTRLTDAAKDSLAALPSLRRVYLWKSGLSPDAVASLRAARASLEVDAGDRPDAAIVAEGPAPASIKGGAPPAASSDALKPSNTCCPVTGKPLDPDVAIVYKGKVIGFCCKHCLAQFLEDPAKFEANIK